ncbi:MAG: SpoIIE family protein phosphatase [Leptospiraceae bacterium]|nr:SpoIIE family protein phosphatase [Leptospiraceae bacterium]
MKKNLTLEELARIVAKINTSEDIMSLLDYIIETTIMILDTEGCSLLLYKKEDDSLEFYVSRGEKSESLLSLHVPRGKGIAGYVMETRESIIVNDAQNDPRLYKDIDAKVGYTTKNLVCVPMLSRGEFIGVIETVNSLDRDYFDESDLATLTNIAEISAVAIQNRFLLDELENRLKEINGLFQISARIKEIKEPKEFFMEAGKSFCEVLGVERVSFAYYSRNTSEWRLAFSIGLPFQEKTFSLKSSSPVFKRVIEEGEPLLVENTQKENIEFPNSENYKTKSFLCIPIKQEGEVIGIVSLTDKVNRKQFNKNDQKLAGILVHHVTESFNSMNQRVQRENHELLKRDLSIASQIQQYSLPELPETLNGLQLTSSYQASREIGGDFYDLIYHNDHIFTFLIADVAGKGISAALYMEYSKTVLSSEINKNNNLNDAFEECHKQFRKKFTSRVHVEVMAVKIDTKKRIFRFASGGHNRQLFFSKEKNDFILLRTKGIPIGSNFQNPNFSEEEMSYKIGDMIILYTDGITEAKNKSNQMFGEERLMTIVKINQNKPVAEISNKIKKSVEVFTGTTELEDDTTLVIIRLN